MFEAQKVLADEYREMDLPVGVGGQTFFGPASSHPRCFLILFGFPIAHDIEKNRKNRVTFKRLVQVAAEHAGANTAPVRRSCRRFPTSAPTTTALRRFHETLKDTVDPNGMLSPGKCGIWPKHRRQAKA